MPTRRTAILDPGLAARVVDRWPLRYDEGGDVALDRSAHVRSGSSLVWVERELAVIQDDANVIALVDPVRRTVRPLTLPAGHGGARQFEDRRGNKQWKLDLEASVAIEREHGLLLLAFGSGSTSERERIVRVDGWEAGAPAPSLVDATRLYRRLREVKDFSGSELNVEGALRIGPTLRLFSRGNGAQRGDLRPVNASCDLDLSAFLAYLDDPDRADPPEPAGIVQYELGGLGTAPLGFTDATEWRGATLFTASAESSADATQDGPVGGSALGLIAPDGSVRWTPLQDALGGPFALKVEGIAPEGTAPNRVLVVTDVDDPDTATELCTVELSGPWDPRPSDAPAMPAPPGRSSGRRP